MEANRRCYKVQDPWSISNIFFFALSLLLVGWVENFGRLKWEIEWELILAGYFYISKLEINVSGEKWALEKICKETVMLIVICINNKYSVGNPKFIE